MTEEQIKKLIGDKIRAAISFTAHKTTDTPTEGYAPVSRKFLTQNGITTSRPTSSITGLMFFDTTLGQPVWWDGSTWVDATGGAA